MSGQVFPVFKPQLPTFDALAPYFRSIDASRWYSNDGPLLQRFETRLGEHFGVERGNIVTVCNGTMALSQTLRALDVAKGSFCLMPSWTFVATPAAAIQSGLEPYFLDVDEATWTITPEQAYEAAGRMDVGAVIVVSAFGAPLDLAVWDAFTRETGIAVVVDAAAGFDGFRALGSRGACSTPVMISLHATKVSGIGEGALVVTGNPDLAKDIRALGSFGFQGQRNARIAGINAKLSEYAAASGNALLDTWSAQRESWQRTKEHFTSFVKAEPTLAFSPSFEEDWVSSYGQVILPDPAASEDVSRAIAGMGYESRQWWGKGCHTHSAYDRYGYDPLTVTAKLGRRVIGLPYWNGMTREDFAGVFDALGRGMAETAKARETAT